MRVHVYIAIMQMYFTLINTSTASCDGYPIILLVVFTRSPGAAVHTVSCLE